MFRMDDLPEPLLPISRTFFFLGFNFWLSIVTVDVDRMRCYSGPASTENCFALDELWASWRDALLLLQARKHSLQVCGHYIIGSLFHCANEFRSCELVWKDALRRGELRFTTWRQRTPGSASSGIYMMHEALRGYYGFDPVTQVSVMSMKASKPWNEVSRSNTNTTNGLWASFSYKIYEPLLISLILSTSCSFDVLDLTNCSLEHFSSSYMISYAQSAVKTFSWFSLFLSELSYVIMEGNWSLTWTAINTRDNHWYPW